MKLIARILSVKNPLKMMSKPESNLLSFNKLNNLCDHQ